MHPGHEVPPSWEVTGPGLREQGLCVCVSLHCSPPQPQADSECWHHAGLASLQALLAGLREHPASLAGEGGAG